MNKRNNESKKLVSILRERPKKHYDHIKQVY